jgi:peptide/nickel transport system ATP-binding protein
MVRPVLQVTRLRTVINRAGGHVTVLDDVSFAVKPGQMLALVGESGCGKSITALSVMGLLPAPQVTIQSGTILLEGQNLVGLPAKALRQRRGRVMAMIFQEPQSALNPVLTIGEQVEEALRAHQSLSRGAARAAALELLDRVLLPDPRRCHGEYPHRLSGGMCQRVAIAMALAGQPRLLIADEPTTALDVTVQAQILELIARLQLEEAMAVLFITHDLGLVAGYADRVAVMYAGRIVEEAPVDTLFARPLHPYTTRLLQAAPRLAAQRLPGRFAEIPGQVPQLGQRPPGCAFEPRCTIADIRCTIAPPNAFEPAPDHRVACFLAAVDA